MNMKCENCGHLIDEEDGEEVCQADLGKGFAQNVCEECWKSLYPYEYSQWLCGNPENLGYLKSTLVWE